MRATVFSTGEAFVSGVGASGEDKAFRVSFTKSPQLLEIESGESVSLGRMIRSNSSYQILEDATLPALFKAMREYPLLSGVVDNFIFAFRDDFGPEIQMQFFREFEPALQIPHIFSEVVTRLLQKSKDVEGPLVIKDSYDQERLHRLLVASGLTASLHFVFECREKGII
jgi:hypothetical protein